MTDFNFGMLDLVAGQLDKHKEKLGPLHRPLVLLLGAVLFLVFLALLIGAPILWLEDFVYIALLQICLMAAFFMLLLTIPLDVYDRFVFSMAVFIILAAAPVMVTLGYFLTRFEPEDPAAFNLAVASAKPEIFMYALLRGMAHLAWSLPLLFLFFTFHPRIKVRGAGQLESSLRMTFWSALALQTVAVALHLWLGGTSKVFASTASANEYLAGKISGYQLGFLSFQVIYILLGYATIFAARYGYGNNDRRWLAIVVTGMVAVQGSYMLASYNNRELTVRYPASRTSADYVQAWKDRDTGQFVFTIPRPNTISPAKFRNFRTYAVCEDSDKEALKFKLKVVGSDQFSAAYAENSLGNVAPDAKFCQPEPEG